MAEYDIKLDQGSDFLITFVLKDSAKKPINLTGYKVAMQIRKSATSAEAVDTLTTENGRIDVVPLEGRIVLKFPHSVTESISASTYVYDVEIISADDRITRILRGRVYVSAEVTRVNSKQ